MSLNKTVNSSFVEAEIQSDFILRTMHDALMPDTFYRNVSDFGRGETLNIPTIGEVTVQEVSDETPIVYQPIETGSVQLQITDFIGDGYAIKDTLREDGTNIPALVQARAEEGRRAIQEYFESRALATLNAAQTDAGANLVNGRAHRITATGTNNTLTLPDLNAAKLALDKAEVPYGSRIGIIDPAVAASLWSNFNGNYSVDANPVMQDILQGGFARDHEFVMNIAGFSIMTSNRLPKGNFSDGTTAVANGVANIFMSVADDQAKPLMVAWRRMPRVESERNKDFQQDEFVLTARMGFGVQRLDSLVVIITDADLTA